MASTYHHYMVVERLITSTESDQRTMRDDRRRVLSTFSVEKLYLRCSEVRRTFEGYQRVE